MLLCLLMMMTPPLYTFCIPFQVLLLSSKAGGVGLNIIGANRLVLFDPGESSVIGEHKLKAVRFV